MSARILHVARSLRAETGGLAEAVRNLAAAQRRSGDQVTVLSLDPADATDRKVVVLGKASHGYGYTADYVPWLRARRHEFDAVVVHGMWQYQAFGAWRALAGSDTPYVLYCHGMLDVWFKRAHPLKHAKKWLYWPWAEYRVLRDAAAVCYTAEEERRRSRESFWLYRAKERVVPIGIAPPPVASDAQQTAFARAFPALAGRRFILFLGRVHPKKGIDLLLRGYAATWSATDPEAPLLAIAGPGDETYRAALQRQVRQLKVAERVVWLPMISGEVKWGALRACEAFALISHQENFGVAVVEALACGRPVLLSDQIAICREIADDGAGVVGADTAASATAVLQEWKAKSPVARAAMSTAAQRCFVNRFEIDAAAARLSALIAEIRQR